MIHNEPKKVIGDPVIDRVRSAMEHRATWFYLLLDVLKEQGLSVDEARKAIFKCGCIHGDTKYPKTDDMREFYASFLPEDMEKVLEAEATVTEDCIDVNFGYCPLVAAWQKLTDDETYIKHICDIAMDGDRGIISRYPDWKFELGDTIADGCPTCHIKISKKEADSV